MSERQRRRWNLWLWVWSFRRPNSKATATKTDGTTSNKSSASSPTPADSKLSNVSKKEIHTLFLKLNLPLSQSKYFTLFYTNTTRSITQPSIIFKLLKHYFNGNPSNKPVERGRKLEFLQKLKVPVDIHWSRILIYAFTQANSHLYPHIQLYASMYYFSIKSWSGTSSRYIMHTGWEIKFSSRARDRMGREPLWKWLGLGFYYLSDVQLKFTRCDLSPFYTGTRLYLTHRAPKF